MTNNETEAQGGEVKCSFISPVNIYGELTTADTVLGQGTLLGNRR